jgi:hypothetical protein
MQNLSKVPPAVRAQNFAMMTRKYEQQLASKAYVDSSRLSWDIPSSRFLSKITLLVRGTFTMTHASTTTLTKSTFDKFNIFRRIRLEINNGFNPYDISGQMLSLKNKIDNFQDPSADPFALETVGVTASSSGASNNIAFQLELPVTINPRDPIGLINLQNPETIVTLHIDTDLLTKMYTDSSTTAGSVAITVTPIVETFSIPQNPDFVPDYSIIKLVHEQSMSIVSTAEMTIDMQRGLTYRKYGLYLASDTIFTPIAHSYINSFQTIYQGADYPVNVTSDYVAYKNKVAYQGKLPLGCYVFDESEQGIANLGGVRDYIDTERLTLFQKKITFNSLSGATNYAYLFSERLAKML